MAAGAVVPCGFGAPGSVVLDAVPTRGHLEIVPVHPGGAHPRQGPLAAADRAAGVTSLGVQALRRIVGAVARLRGELVRDVTVRCGAAATVRALERVVQPKLAFELLGVKAVRAFDATVVIVSLSARQEARASRLVGAYLTETDAPRGAALAVLNATNRILGNFFATR